MFLQKGGFNSVACCGFTIEQVLSRTACLHAGLVRWSTCCPFVCSNCIYDIWSQKSCECAHLSHLRGYRNYSVCFFLVCSAHLWPFTKALSRKDSARSDKQWLYPLPPETTKPSACTHSFTGAFPVSTSICVVTQDWQWRITGSHHPSAGPHAITLSSAHTDRTHTLQD